MITPPLRIAMISYPMLFQHSGGLQVQVRETIAALVKLGVEARLVDPTRDRLVDYDIIHVFSAINGNHRIVESARALGVGVVVSPLIQPHWNKRLAMLARLLESLVGRLTAWNVKTEYRQIASALHGADALVALGDVEKRSIMDAFRIDKESIRVIPNGIPERFFRGNPSTFRQATGIHSDFVLCVASINTYKNQLGLARALEGSGLPLVLIGPCQDHDRSYLGQLSRHSHVRYLGGMDYTDPLLASAYAAATVFCLPSNSEVMPLSVMESLAAGTPVVMTRNHAMDVSGMREVCTEVCPSRPHEIGVAIHAFVESRPVAERCREAVRGFTWEAVAEQLRQCYQDVLQMRQAGDPAPGSQPAMEPGWT